MKTIQSNFPKLSNKKCKLCSNLIYMKRKRDEVKEFCNRKCAANFLFSKKKENTCKICNKIFFTIPSYNHKFCSRACSNKNKCKVYVRYCRKCNVKFILQNIAYERRGGGRFCSVKCGTRTYNFNEEYFENINSSEKAYWLGFLFADGNIYKNQLTLKLQQTDKNHLKKFKIALDSEHPIHDGISITNNKQYFYSSFFIGSKKLCYDLIKINLIQNKSFKIKFPRIEEKFYSHFIRGYFDGDGCIYINKKKYKRWSIFSASENFILKLKDILFKNLKVKISLYKQGKGYILSGANKNIVKLFYDYIYNNATVFLDRKHEKFLF